MRPREDGERLGIRPEVHVGFLEPDEPLNRRAVEDNLAVERFLELPVRDLDVLDRAEDVRELEAEELHLLALGELEDAGLRHRPLLRRGPGCHADLRLRTRRCPVLRVASPDGRAPERRPSARKAPVTGPPTLSDT